MTDSRQKNNNALLIIRGAMIGMIPPLLAVLTSYGMGLPLWVCGVNYFIQFIMYIHSAINATEHFYDLTGSSTYFVLALLTLLSNFSSLTTPRIINAVCVMLWSGRLGIFLFSRIQAVGKDERFDGIRDRPARLFVFWMLQGLWVHLVGAPVFLFNTTPSNLVRSDVGMMQVIGWGLWVAGFVVEAVSDYQKNAFKSASPAHASKPCMQGLFAVVRFPNYAGEILLWFGLALACASGLSLGRSVWCFLSPAFTAFLLIFVSGVPLLDKKHRTMYGHLPDWQRYAANTSNLVPGIF